MAVCAVSFCPIRWQVAYAETEGYVPVTKSAGIRRYLGLSQPRGEDNENYYDVKIKASKLLLEHADDTFITPVFNGSASLRDRRRDS